MDFKSYAIETFEIAQWNVLKAIFRLHPKDFEKQMSPKTNDIRWMIGHLTNHMDYIFNHLCRGRRQLKQELQEYFPTGTPDASKRGEFPVSIRELINSFLDIYESSLEYLYKLPKEKFNELPEYNENNAETISELLQRITLHFLGHVGQIYFIKRLLGKGGYFVAGVKKNLREDSKDKWVKWWNENKEKYS